MGQDTPLQLTIEFPDTRGGWDQLQRRVSDLHAQFLLEYLRHLPISTEAKLELLRAMIAEVQAKQTI